MANRGKPAKTILRKAVLLLATVSALTMPVSYTGGRSVAHPHAFMQLFFDAARGTTSHHQMGGMTHHVPPIHRDVFLVDVPDDTPVMTIPSGAMERVALIGSVLAAASVLFLAGPPRIGSVLGRLTGIAVIPDIPPPRPVAIL
jgi:hypothetical protein